MPRVPNPTARPLLALAFCLWGLNASAANAASATSAAPCDKPVRFGAGWFPEPELDTSKTAAEITKLGGAAGGAGTQLGHVVVQTKLTVVPQQACAGLVVRLEFVKPVLRVAKEFPPDSCAYARVMNHELTHVRLYRDIAAQFRDLHYPWDKGVSAASVLAWTRLELDRLLQAQALFDSPQEYARNATVCGGEIERRMNPAAPAGAVPTAGSAAPQRP